MSEEMRAQRHGEPRRSRPRMPASYGLEPAAEQAMLSWDGVRERMAGARNYWLATARPNGRPHVAPVWGVWLDDALYFATDPASRKGRNLAMRQDLVVHLESGDDVVILEGLAVTVTDAPTLARFANAYEEKYQFRPDTSSAAPGVFRVRPRVAYAWREQDFPKTATRWSFGPD